MAKINMLASDKSILRFLRGPRGYKVIGADISALEPHLIAAYSGCPNYMFLYGTDANPNQDAYIWLGMQIPRFERVFAPHYNIQNPTKEGIAYIKEHYAVERQICKVFFLSCVYGAHPPRLKGELELKGVNLPLQDVQAIHQAYWKTFRAVKKFTQTLQIRWRENDGYIVSGRGTPRAISAKAVKDDTLSRFVQGTGHQFVMRWLYHIQQVREERGVDMRPLIPDMHDATYWTAPEDQAEAAGEVVTTHYGTNRSFDAYVWRRRGVCRWWCRIVNDDLFLLHHHAAGAIIHFLMISPPPASIRTLVSVFHSSFDH